MNRYTKQRFVAPFNVKYVISFLSKAFEKNSQVHHSLCQSDKAQSNKDKPDKDHTQNIDINSSHNTHQSAPRTSTQKEKMKALEEQEETRK